MGGEQWIGGDPMQYASDSYYAEERRLFKDCYDLQMSDDDSLLILRKLCRRYKVRMPHVRFWGDRDSGSDGWRGIRLSHNPTLGLVLHEFAHRAHKNSPEMRELCRRFENKGTSHHGLHYQCVLRRIVDYARSKDLWRDQLAKRKAKRAKQKAAKIAAKKPVKDRAPGEVIDEKLAATDAKIRRNEERIAGFEKKLQRLTKLYMNKIKKYRRSTAALKRAKDKYLQQAADIGA
jgi:hypothetical protein